MKKSKKKVASTMDERAQLISGESSARGYWVAMLGIFVTIMVASKTHSTIRSYFNCRFIRRFR